eukprot:1059193-Rhodomonas_salina.2
MSAPATNRDSCAGPATIPGPSDQAWCAFSACHGLTRVRHWPGAVEKRVLDVTAGKRAHLSRAQCFPLAWYNLKVRGTEAQPGFYEAKDWYLAG